MVTPHLITSPWTGIPILTVVIGYPWFRGICVMLNNGCCRIIEWAQEDERS